MGRERLVDRAASRDTSKGGTAPDEIDAINAHGTSTPMGDEIELGAEHGGGRDLVAVAKRCPAFDEDVGFEQAIHADLGVLLDDAELADADLRADDGVGVDPRRRSARRR